MKVFFVYNITSFFSLQSIAYFASKPLACFIPLLKYNACKKFGYSCSLFNYHYHCYCAMKIFTFIKSFCTHCSRYYNIYETQQLLTKNLSVFFTWTISLFHQNRFSNTKHIELCTFAHQKKHRLFKIYNSQSSRWKTLWDTFLVSWVLWVLFLWILIFYSIAKTPWANSRAGVKI